jgi:hypothetical protein
MTAPKFLRLNAEEVGVLVKVFNSLRLSTIPQEERQGVFDIRDRLGRFYVATAEELNTDHECRGRQRRQ